MGLHSILNFTSVYNLAQRFLGSRRASDIFINDYIKPVDGQMFLDFGCGTGKLFESLNNWSNIKYFGIEPNSKYVDGSKVRYRQFSNAHFYTGSSEVLSSISEKFDTIIVSAVLHHIQTESWSRILDTLYLKLKPGGKLILLDNIFHHGQNLFSRFLVSLDRGKSVVKIDEYLNLINGNYHVKYDLRTDLLNVPYSHVITTIT